MRQRKGKPIDPARVSPRYAKKNRVRLLPEQGVAEWFETASAIRARRLASSAPAAPFLTESSDVT